MGTQKTRSSSDVPSRHLPYYLSLTSGNRNGKRSSIPTIPKTYQRSLSLSLPTPLKPHLASQKNTTLSSLLQNHMTILQTHPSSPPTMSKSPPSPRKKPPSPTNISHFPTDGWMSNTRPTTCGVSGCIGTIIGYKDYYLKNKRVLCTHVFSVAAVTTTTDDGASPLGSTELDDKTGHNCKMSKEFYTSFGLLILGLNHDS